MEPLERQAQRESWRSRIGFIFAGIGSAVGLVNIWRFPYIVAENGGAAFIVVYLLCLGLVGFPVLVSETLIGRTARRGPVGALCSLATSAPCPQRFWRKTGLGIVITGFIVSSFYSVVAGWMIGYLIEAISGQFASLNSFEVAADQFKSHIGSASWCLGYHFAFMALAIFVLSRGVRQGIESLNKFLMPLLVLLLLFVMGRGLSLPGGKAGMIDFFSLDFTGFTAWTFLTALGHAFFTLSLGQGTMITYGSYLSDRDNIPNSCFPIVFFDTLVSLLAGIAVLSILFAGGEASNQGFALLFSTLPTVFGEIPGGQWVGIAFFLLVLFAALTSQISAIEPIVNYLMDEKKWNRRSAVLCVGGAAFLVGVPSALAFNALRGMTVRGWNFFEWISFITMDLFIPLGGLAAILYVGWVWGTKRAFPYLYGEQIPTFRKGVLLRRYLSLCIRFVAPLAILLILLSALII
ncbi:MAG: sodium-dependent transporter [Verrucomicrobia bacterium]|nr:sodium-dependent transporter [Verrucomicrobiota bacterium]